MRGSAGCKYTDGSVLKNLRYGGYYQTNKGSNNENGNIPEQNKVYDKINAKILK